MHTPPIDDILKRLHDLQAELETEVENILSEKRELFQYTLKKGRVRFERSMLAFQRSHKQGTWNYLRNARTSHLLSAPIVYSLVIPIAILDLMVSFYQLICFRIYDIPLVQRSKYVIIDRHKLAYLNPIEKLNCIFCGYGNGIIEYAREVTARTEHYWCPIKHARRTPDPHRLIECYVDYGDVDSYKSELKNIRKSLRSMDKTDQSPPGQ